MESPAAATTSFWTFIGSSIFILNFITYVECSNRSLDILHVCPQNCTCLGDSHSMTVNCSNSNYREVPSNLPSGTSTLILDGNPLNRLTNEGLSMLAGVRNLSLSNCRITDVDEKGFSHLSENLRELSMSDNPLKNKACKFLKHLQNLKSLDLSGNEIAAYPTVLGELSYLRRLNLAHNSIKAFPRNTISPTLQSLNLSFNHIGTLSYQRKREQKASTPSRREGLRPRNKSISEPKISKSRMKQLILRGNQIRELENNTFEIFPKLAFLDLALNRLRDVQPLAFRSDSLKAIDLSGTKFRLHDDNWNMFLEAPNILRINIGFARIECGVNLTRAAFQNLRNLTDFDFSGTEIKSLSQMFVNVTNLAKLRLSGNQVSTLGKQDFEGITDSLRQLIVSSGRLSTISYDSLPLKVWKNLRVVDFSNNPFLCDCNFIWLRSWLKRANASKVEVKGWDKYYCQTTKGQVGMFQLESPSDVECFQDLLSDDHWVLTVHLLTSLIWITATSASALHRFRWHLRYWYFMKTVHAKKRTERFKDEEEPDFFTFDVFVGYSRSDSNWLITQLLPRLEQECNLRLCIHERNWLPGGDIAENILESIDSSRKTLLIVSNAFALSPWCHFELTMAQTRLMEEDRDSLVLILLEEIADCNLTPRLQIQMQRRTYIEWTKQSNVGQQLFWANLKHALAKPSDSLMNAYLSTELLK